MLQNGDKGKEKNDSNMSSLAFGSSLENSAFQNVPSYEVDMLTDFEDTPNIEEIKAQEAQVKDESLKNNLFNKKELLNSELTPTLDTSDKTAEHEVTKKVLQADNIQFSAPEFPTLAESESIFDISESDASEINGDKDENMNQSEKKSNVIEWDLPKKD